MRMGVTMVSSLPFFPFFHALSSFFLIIWRLSSWVLEAHLESFTSNQLPLKCESTVTFSLISSLRASPFPSNKLCKSRRNNLTNLNQTFYIPAVFFVFLWGEEEDTDSIFCMTEGCIARRCVANIQIGCSCPHLPVAWILWPTSLLSTENWT